ncbi:hypothetical protein J6590_031227 [Homalodisca vitripennis]|nr:hypothetical protein J6590_031227 [Homalodisca vitripennis]
MATGRIQAALPSYNKYSEMHSVSSLPHAYSETLIPQRYDVTVPWGLRTHQHVSDTLQLKVSWSEP